MERIAIPTISQRQFLAALLTVFVLTSVAYTAKVLTPRDGETTRSAIVRWRNQLLTLDSGENIYEKFTYPNPPVMAVMLRPLASLPPVAGALVWFYLKVGMALASFAIVFRLARDGDRAFPPWAQALTVVLSIRPVLGDLMHGNVNLLIVFLVLAGLALYRADWDFTAGLFLALAIACKVTPALFLVYFVWKRAWRVAAGMAAGLGLFLLVVPALVLGWADNLELLQSWFEKMVLPFLAGGQITSEHPNQSLPGLLTRLFTHSPSFSDYEGDKYVPQAYHTIVDLGTMTRWLAKACMATFALTIALCCRTPTRPRASAKLGIEYAIIVLGMLLFSERTWKHHAVTLILPFGILCYQLAAADLSRRMKQLTVGVLIASSVLMLATSTDALPDAWAKVSQVYGAYTFVFLMQSAMLFGLLANPQAEAAPVGLRRAA
ncbi:MAG: DUF2029 domain-containing protein [Gemmataceae bacterium]|nr:DUF2029 domain-containing protein [Gemmataceae bacterium]